MKSRKSRSQMFFKIGGLKNFPIFTGKHLSWGILLIKLQAWSPVTLLKKTLTQVFFYEFVVFLWTASFTEHLWWLLRKSKNSLHCPTNILLKAQWSILPHHISLLYKCIVNKLIIMNNYSRKKSLESKTCICC